MKTNEIPLYLAPMAGVGDRAFRELCAQFGADFFCTEMISAKAVHFKDKKTAALAETGEVDRPIAIQLFGSDPEIMGEAARTLGDGKKCEWIDLNFGCPVPKIAGNGDGSALMKDPRRCGEVVRAVVEATALPVSVKIRAGWDQNSINAPEIARICEEAGARRIAVHGRTRSDFYRDGTLRPAVIRAVKEAVSVPVIANGDIRDGESALRLLDETRCDGLMIGRGAVGSPWVFLQVRAALTGKTPDPVDQKEAIGRHLELAFRYKPQTAGREMRTHMVHYLKGFRGAASLRERVAHAQRLEDYLELVEALQD